MCLAPDSSRRQEDTFIVELADMVITSGLGDILFPLLRHAGGTNLAILPANLVDGDQVAAHDPHHGVRTRAVQNLALRANGS